MKYSHVGLECFEVGSTLRYHPNHPQNSDSQVVVTLATCTNPENFLGVSGFNLRKGMRTIHSRGTVKVLVGPCEFREIVPGTPLALEQMGKVVAASFAQVEIGDVNDEITITSKIPGIEGNNFTVRIRHQDGITTAESIGNTIEITLPHIGNTHYFYDSYSLVGDAANLISEINCACGHLVHAKAKDPLEENQKVYLHPESGPLQFSGGELYPHIIAKATSPVYGVGTKSPYVYARLIN